MIRPGSRRDLVLSFVLACSVVVGLILVLDRSLNGQPDTRLEPVMPRPESSNLSRRDQSSQLPQEPTPQRFAVAPPEQASDRIFKCVIEGRTVYGSMPCQAPDHSRSLALHVPSGIGGPPRENADTLRARRLQNERQQSEASRVMVLAKPERAQCMALNEHVAYLDALARQPQPAAMQDWIRSERSSTRDRQFRLGC